MDYTGYFACTALSAAAGGTLAALRLRRRGVPLRTGTGMVLVMALLGVLGARLYCAACQLPERFLGEYGLLAEVPYAYAVCGAVLGAVLGCVLGARAAGIPSGRALDAAAPGGMLALALSRISELLADFGWGNLIPGPRWQFFPVAVRDPFGDWWLALNLLEALFALAVLGAFVKRESPLPGAVSALCLSWWAMSQILCESLRVETVRWGFVRVQQVQCALFGLAVLVWALKKAKGPLPGALFRLGAYLAGTAAVTGIEFALDRLPWPRWADYLCMALVLAGMGWNTHRAVGRAERAAL